MRFAYTFIGKEGKYQIPKNAIVSLIKTYPKRKCVIFYEGKKYVTFVSLLRKRKPPTKKGEKI